VIVLIVGTNTRTTLRFAASKRDRSLKTFAIRLGSDLSAVTKAPRLVFDYLSVRVIGHLVQHTTEGMLLPILMTSPATRESQYFVRKSDMVAMNQSICAISRKPAVLRLSCVWSADTHLVSTENLMASCPDHCTPL